MSIVSVISRPMSSGFVRVRSIERATVSMSSGSSRLRIERFTVP